MLHEEKLNQLLSLFDDGEMMYSEDDIRNMAIFNRLEVSELFNKLKNDGLITFGDLRDEGKNVFGWHITSKGKAFLHRGGYKKVVEGLQQREELEKFNYQTRKISIFVSIAGLITSIAFSAKSCSDNSDNSDKIKQLQRDIDKLKGGL